MQFILIYASSFLYVYGYTVHMLAHYFSIIECDPVWRRGRFGGNAHVCMNTWGCIQRMGEVFQVRKC